MRHDWAAGHPRKLLPYYDDVGGTMLTIFLRALILYLLTVVALRALGKSQLGQFQPYEFALALMIADLMSTPMGDHSAPLLHGALPAAGLIVAHSLLTFLIMRSDKLRAFISGRASLVVRKGVIDRNELKRLGLSLSELLEGMRECGILDPAALNTAIVESNGNVSAFTAKEVCTIPLILDGRMQQGNLALAKLTEARLLGWIGEYNLAPEQILLLSLGENGQAHIQDMRGAVICMQVPDFEEVDW